MRLLLLALAALTAACSGPAANDSAAVQTKAQARAEGLPAPTMADLAYAGVSPAQRLHLYLPEGEGPFPLVIMVHGGGFSSGDPRDVGPGFKANVEALHKAGLAVASVGYRLSGEAPFPAAVRDVKAAIRFLRANAAAHRLDGERIALWGKSAGGNLVLLAGLAQDKTLFDDPELADPKVDDSVKAIVAFYPPVDFTRMEAHAAARGCKPEQVADGEKARYLGKDLKRGAARSNPVNYVTGEAPPVYLAAGARDCTVAPEQSRLMFEALKAKAPEAGSQLFILEGAGHADPVFEEGENLQRVIAFLNTHLKSSAAL